MSRCDFAAILGDSSLSTVLRESQGTSRYNLAAILESMHRLLGGPLADADAKLWKSMAKEFATEVNVVTKSAAGASAEPRGQLPNSKLSLL